MALWSRSPVIELGGECPLLAQSGHPDTPDQCPLLGVKRKLRGFRAKLSRVRGARSGFTDGSIAALSGDRPQFARRPPRV